MRKQDNRSAGRKGRGKGNGWTPKESLEDIFADNPYLDGLLE